MRFGQKLAYMALGGVLVLVGHTLPGLVVPKATAQGEAKPSAEYDTLTVRSLKVVDAAGRVRAQIEVTKRPSVTPVEDMIEVFNAAGVAVYRVGVDADGGNVRVLGNDGELRVGMRASSEGGGVIVFGNDGKPRAAMLVSPEGGAVSVQGNDGETRAGMRASPEGGAVSVFGNDGKRHTGMGVSSDGGFVSVRGNDGKPRATMGVDKNGGTVGVLGNDEKPRALMVALPEGGFVFTYNWLGRTTGSLP